MNTDLQAIEHGHPALIDPARNPAAVYLASLSPGSRRDMNQSLEVVAEILTGSPAIPASIPWWKVEYQHSQAIHAELAERYAPAAGNKILSALRGVLRESWRLGFMDAEQFHRAIDFKAIKGNPAPKGRAVTTGEIIALVNICKADPSQVTGARDVAMLAVLYSGGLRRTEVVSLDIADYDPETGALTVHNAKGRKGPQGFPQKWRQSGPGRMDRRPW